MAVTRLYPPNIAGTLPSFYGTAELAVPFSMNVLVAENQVKSLKLKIRTASADILLAELTSKSVNFPAGKATFDISSISGRLIKGNFYKIQIAYVGHDDVIGYYSTTAVIKYTDKPEVSIVGLSDSATNTIVSQKFIGNYSNSDSTEVVYKYRFVVAAADGSEIENSGWLLHSQQDEYVVKADLGNSICAVSYEIITNNYLTASSPAYSVLIATNTGAPKFSLQIKNVNYENGSVNVYAKGNNLKGGYILFRAASTNDYRTWDTINAFTISGEFLYTDYTVAAGVSYKYSLQKSDYSEPKSISPIVTPYFEHLFLYDGTRQLKVSFNPKVSSFKPVLQESLKTTLGNKYPFILRNGAVDYKELSLSGLISYLSDNDELFMQRSDFADEYFRDTTDLTDENIAAERRFKTKVLEWLTNGEVKLLRSPYEGNFIVRLLNVSLAPQETLGRMLHTFTCTADEVADYSVSALVDYNILAANEKSSYKETISLSLLKESLVTQGKNETEIETMIKDTDFSKNFVCNKVEISCDKGYENQLYGTIVKWGENSYIIDHSGNCTLTEAYPVNQPLMFVKLGVGWEHAAITLTVTENLLEEVAPKLKQLFGYSVNGFEQAGADLFKINTNIYSIVDIEYKLLPVAKVFSDDAIQRLFVNSGYQGVVENSIYANRLIVKKDGQYYIVNNQGELAPYDYSTIVTIDGEPYDIAATKPNKIPQKSLIVPSGVVVYVYGFVKE